MNNLLIWDRINPINKLIRQFFKDLETYFKAKGIAIIRKHSLLDKLVRYPAKLAYDAAIGVAIVNPVIEGNDAVRLQLAEDRYTNRKNWLIERYHGPQQQEAIRDAMTTMMQFPDENPAMFYARIATAAS